MDEHSVKVYIYDISRGLARSMSLPLLGKHLDGIWHTGIVVYGEEFFFGGDGINSCHPSGTILGEPDTVEDLGKTQIPREVFMEYLHELSQTTFRGVCYHLLNHNCNNFSDEVAQFLTGKSIPSYITGLPQEVLQTPFGGMIKPFLDSMSMNPGGDSHPLFSDNASAAVSPPTAGPAHQTTTTQRTDPPTPNPSATSQSAARSSPTNEDAITLPTFNDKKAGEDVRASRVSEWLASSEAEVVKEVCEFAGSVDCTWSLGRSHIRLLVNLCMDSTITEQQRKMAARLLQDVALNEDIMSVFIHDPTRPIQRLLRKQDDLDNLGVLLPVAKCICNCANKEAGRQWLLQRENYVLPCGLQTCNIDLCSKLAALLVLHQLSELNHVGICLMSFIATHYRDSERAVDFGSALIQVASRKVPAESGSHFANALVKCMEANREVSGLALVLGLDITSLREEFPSLCHQWDKLQQLVGSMS